jgi:hypothetical protein
MPFPPDAPGSGHIIWNPLGVPSRMNVGQILSQLDWQPISAVKFATAAPERPSLNVPWVRSGAARWKALCIRGLAEVASPRPAFCRLGIPGVARAGASR